MPETPQVPSMTASAIEEAFPTLTEAQIARIALHGRLRQVQSGEVLIEAGESVSRFFVVTSGEVQFVRPNSNEPPAAILQPGMFTGEITMLSGRRGLAQLRVSLSGEVIEVEREHLLGIVQTDSELSDIFMRAFILRRSQLIAQGIGDVVLVGSTHCVGTLRVKEFLTRNGHPYTSIENYLGFPTGISGQELAARAYNQAQKFGAQLMIAKAAKHLVCDRKPYAIDLDEGPRVSARTIIIATGAEYRTLTLEGPSRFEGGGVSRRRLLGVIVHREPRNGLLTGKAGAIAAGIL